jgi:cobalt/nickel transport system ATP-binding protein
MPFINAYRLSYVYPDGNTAIAEISFSIESGEKIALIGHNGSGKSTLLLLLSALIMPTNGKLVVAEIPASSATKTHIRKTTGMLFSQVEYQFIMPDCLNDVMLSIKEGTKEERKSKALELLSHVGLSHEAWHNPLSLSSGQMKRAALAAVLAKNPSLLLLDEPLANLDRPSSDLVINILSTLDITTVFATHSRHAVQSMATRVIVLESGRIAFDGSAKSREAKKYYDEMLL